MVAVTRLSPSMVGAVRLPNTGSEPSPKSQVKLNSSMPVGGVNVARNRAGILALTV